MIIQWLIVLAPLIAAPITLAAGKWKRNLAGIIASLSIGISLAISGITYFGVSSGSTYQEQFTWFSNVSYGIYIDPLAVTMALMVSFVSLMIHLFAMYYMGKDPNRHVYFAETSLFTAGMLGIAVSSNLLEFFMFWELVGLCSYLLIGFWFFKPNATAAAKKAFIVTRVGDLLFLIGLVALYEGITTSALSADPLGIQYLITHSSAVLAALGSTKLFFVTVMLLGGAIGKSSQFPLHVWIPDAMEGPTTVSALIHAATMVTAGIYLVARVYPLFVAAGPDMLYILAILGAFTAFMAGTMGIVMNDIKRILAYSTISQLGYMLSALGLFSIYGSAAVGISLYHLVSHAFFKAMLFMSAGAILIALMDLRDVRQMGGLWKKMPVTVTLLFIGSITLAAVPFTSAYFSKDTIISASWLYYSGNGSIMYALPWFLLELGSLMTVLYTFRMFFLVAIGKPRSFLAEHARDPPLVAMIPVAILGFFSLVFGVFQGSFYNFVSGFSVSVKPVPLEIELIPLLMLVLGVAVAYLIYGTGAWSRLKLSRLPGYKFLKNKYYLDRLYTNVIAERGILPLSGAFGSFEDSYNTANVRAGRGVLSFGSLLRKLQSGIVENYFLVIIVAFSIIFVLVDLMGGF